MQDQLHLHAIHFFHRRLFFTIIAKESEFVYMQKHIFDEKYKDFEYHLHLPLGRVNDLRHNNSNSNNLFAYQEIERFDKNITLWVVKYSPFESFLCKNIILHAWKTRININGICHFK